jgi:glucose-6-phosphate dehydrogenase assembly protein OpcA
MDWRGQAVTIGDVASQLGRARAEAAGAHQPLASVLNLIAWARFRSDADAAEAMIEELADHQPSRAVVISVDPDRDEMDAHVATHVSTSGPVGEVAVELVTLVLPGDATPHAASAVVPLLRADLPTFLWWPCTPDPADEALLSLAGIADRLISEIGDDRAAAEALRRLGAVLEIGPAVTDLAWAAITPWRQLVVQTSGPEALARLREGPATAVVIHGGPTPTAEALLMAGWLAAGFGRGLSVRLAPREAAEDSLFGLDLAREDGWRLSVRLLPGRATGAVSLSRPGADQLIRVMPLPRRDRAALLAGELEVTRRDHPFERSVRAALALAG